MSKDELSLKDICDTKCDNYKCCTSTGPAFIFDFEIKDKLSIDEYVKNTDFPEIKIVQRDEYGCPYLDKGNCLIQEIKFIDCRIYPLGLNKEGNLGIDKNNECPATKYLTDEFFKTVEDIVNQIPLDIRKKMGEINEQNGYFYVPIKKE